ncbi:MAG: PQQ-dependent sugar dehydrogenase [Vicinamibacterales bacterium]
MRVLQVILSAVLVVLVPGFAIAYVFDRPFWEMDLGSLVGYAIGFVAAAARLGFQSRARRVTLVDTVFTATATTALTSVALPWFGVPPLGGTPLALLYVGSVFLAALLFYVPGFDRTKLGILLATGVVAAALHVRFPFGAVPKVDDPSDSTTAEDSTLYGIDIRRHLRHIPKPAAAGGGLALLSEGYLLATGDGLLYAFRQNGVDRSLEIRGLGTRVPINHDAFSAAIAGLPVDAVRFHVADVETLIGNGRIRVLASHHYWKPEGRCFTLRLSMLEADYQAFVQGQPQNNWSTIFESSPCLPFMATEGLPHGHAFQGIQLGGRMAMRDDHTVVLGVGDQGYDGVNSTIDYVQDTTTSYGKMLLIDLRTGRANTLSMGHRNQQGVLVASKGTIWETEHGPYGGDELNRINAGGNYGWPIVTHGVQYGTRDWPRNTRQGAHDGYTEPVFAWVPSIGISNLIEVQGELFSRWRGDLIVGSLTELSLWRLRLVDERPVVVEQIMLGERVRDLIEGPLGELVVWSDATRALLFLSPSAGEETGGQLFAQCSGCHAIGGGTSPLSGPDLRGVVGRRIAAAPGFDYSEALRSMKGTWTETALSQYLANPTRFVPGTTMVFPGMSDETSRKRLIEYLTPTQ